MAGNSDYKNKWLSENKERISVIVDRGEKEKIKAHAESLGMSLNAYIVKLVEKDMDQPL